MAVVIDSSIFVAAERAQFDWIGFHAQLGAEPLYLSVITLSELLHGVQRANTPERCEKRRAFIAEVEARYPLLSFGRGEAAEYAKVWVELTLSGNLIGAHDQMIAATARHRGYRLATLNSRDFARVPDLHVIDAGSFRIAPG